MLIFCVSKAMELPSLLYDNIITPTLACTLVVLFFMCKLFLTPKNDAQHKRLALEVPGAWPIIGHLHLLAGRKTPTHLILASMADKYGPIFRMRLGSQPVLVVSDSIVDKECFKAKDKELATRPKFMASEIMGYNYSMFAIAPYGEYWREIRNIVLLELLSNRRIEMLRKVRESHVRKAIKRTFDHWSHNKDPISGAVVVEMGQWFSRLSMNLSIAMLFGEEEVAEESQILKSIRNLFELFGETLVSDFIPWLRWMDLGGYEKAMRKTVEEMDCAADRWLKEHRTKRNLKSKEEEDFMDAMLSLFDAPSNQTHPLGFDTDVIIKSTCLVFDLHPSCRERNIAFTSSSFTLCTHEAIEDCTINGYHIQKGTRVISNLAKIHRDPKVWVDPNEFRPERFLTTHKDIDVKGNNFEIIPFGSGRRMCPGMILGLQIVHMTLASLIQSFDMKRPSIEPIDMTQSPGLTTAKATPLYVLLMPRLGFDLFLNATMFSNLGVYFILDPPQLIIIVQNHLSAAQSISSAVFLIAFSYPPKSIHLSQGIQSDTGISANSSSRLLMDFNSWLSSATSSSPKSIAMERLMINLENHCFISTTTAPEIGSLLCDQ
nr:cytochrome P450 CYP82D47-like [Ipomoea batatas]